MAAPLPPDFMTSRDYAAWWMVDQPTKNRVRATSTNGAEFLERLQKKLGDWITALNGRLVAGGALIPLTFPYEVYRHWNRVDPPERTGVWDKPTLLAIAAYVKHLAEDIDDATMVEWGKTQTPVFQGNEERLWWNGLSIDLQKEVDGFTDGNPISAKMTLTAIYLSYLYGGDSDNSIHSVRVETAGAVPPRMGKSPEPNHNFNRVRNCTISGEGADPSECWPVDTLSMGSAAVAGPSMAPWFLGGTIAGGLLGYGWLRYKGTP